MDFVKIYNMSFEEMLNSYKHIDDENKYIRECLTDMCINKNEMIKNGIDEETECLPRAVCYGEKINSSNISNPTQDSVNKAFLKHNDSVRKLEEQIQNNIQIKFHVNMFVSMRFLKERDFEVIKALYITSEELPYSKEWIWEVKKRAVKKLEKEWTKYKK